MKRIYWLILGLLLPTAAHATVIPQFFTQTYTCTGSTGPFPFNYPLSAPPAMTVTKNGVLLASTAYSIVPINNNYTNGGSITLLAACPAGQTLVLKRATPLTQTSVFTDNMPIPMKTLENGLDKLTEIMQEQAARLIDIQAGFVSGHCTNLVFVGGRWILTDSGGPCGTGGGGGTCPAGAENSVQYNNSGACAGSAQFITDSQGNVEIEGGTNGSGTLEINSAFDSGYWLFNEATATLHAHGGNGQTGTLQLFVDDQNYTGGSTGLVPFYVDCSVYRANKNCIGIEVQTDVRADGGNFTGVESDQPNFHGHTSATSHRFKALTSGQGEAAGETGYLVESSIAPTSSGYSDFLSREVDNGHVRVALGVGSDSHNLFGGPVSVADGSGQGGTFNGLEGTAATPAAGHDLLWADATSHCWMIANNGGSGVCIPTSGGGGLSGQTVNYLPKANSATTSTGPSIISDDGTTATVHGAVAVNDGSGSGGILDLTEGTLSSSPLAGHDFLYADSTSHCVKYSPNGASYTCLGNSGWDVSGPNTITSYIPAIVPTTVGANAGFVLVPNGADTWSVVGTGSGSPPNTVSFFNVSAVKTPLAIFSHSGVSSVGTYKDGVFGWNSDADFASGTLDTGLSRDSAGVVDCGNGTTGNKSCTFKAATGTFSSALTVAGNNVCQSTGTNCPASGTATTIASSETVASSATPTFSVSFNVSYNVLTANVTTFTLAAGSDGQSKTLTFCQNGTGNFTVAPPANVHGFFTVGLTASKCSSQHFNYSTAQTAWLADSLGIINE